MNWIIDNWVWLSVVIGFIISILIVVIVPKNWLLWAVLKAETELGDGTGQLKLLMVYNMFIERFPVISKFMPFKVFSILVDKALDKMKDILQNEAIQNIVDSRSTI